MSTLLKHLLLATVEDPFSRSSWSGIPFSLREALERKVDRLSVFQPSRPSRNPLDVARRLWHGGNPPRYPLWMTNATLRANARELKREIARVQPDAVLSISSQCIALLGPVELPVFLFSDAPWLAWREAYEGTLSTPLRVGWFAEQEAKAARRLDGLCFGSDWAVSEARRLYQSGAADTASATLASRLHVTPLGANWVPQGSRESVLAQVDLRARDAIELLFVGRDWVRKGGPLTVEVARALDAGGHAVHLHIVGCRPELPGDVAPFVSVHGLLSRDDPEQSAKLAELFHRSHFLLVPTLAECFGIAFAEAQAFALPPISRAVHALPTVIENGVTGILIDPAAPASSYVERILTLWRDPQAYRAMAVQARDRFESLLNWDVTAEEILRLMALQLAERTVSGEMEIKQTQATPVS